PMRTAQCTACTEWCSPDDLAIASCGHEYCRDCLRALFRASLADETLFPPKCCKQLFDLESCHALLTSDLVTQYGEKEVEFRTPAVQRTYCHACSAFVPRQRVEADVAYCGRPGCHAQTCTFCKAASHEGSHCPQDPARQELERLAAAEGWQHCYGCNRIVELDTGCYHITCRCGADFCYLCGEAWIECTCPQRDEARLFRRAEANVDRNVGAAPMGHREWAAALVEWQRLGLARLWGNHECDHTAWIRRWGAHTGMTSCWRGILRRRDWTQDYSTILHYYRVMRGIGCVGFLV
ncbi:uncharacterized protein B0T15DRAFT_394498, partial [Chaetomium strumarium]